MNDPFGPRKPSPFDPRALDQARRDPHLLEAQAHGAAPVGYIPAPSVTEMTHRGEMRYDIWSRLLVDRIVFLGFPIDDQVANLMMAQLLYLASQDPEKDIHLYLNSPGGVITAGMAIYDTMQFIQPDVATICVGQAASMAAVLLAAGAKGKRRALPHSRVLIHQPLGGFRRAARPATSRSRPTSMLRWKEAPSTSVLADPHRPDRRSASSEGHRARSTSSPPSQAARVRPRRRGHHDVGRASEPKNH